MKRILFISFLFMAYSCGQSLSPENYVGYIESDKYPYRITKKYNDKEFTLIYTPNEYLALKPMVETGTVNKERFQSEVKSKEEYIHFVFIIKSSQYNETVVSESSNLESYSNNLMYMINDVQFDFSLKQNGKEIPCVFANYERNYGLTDKNNIQVVFQKPEKMNDIKVVYNDRMFNTGPIVFDFNDIDVKKINI